MDQNHIQRSFSLFLLIVAAFIFLGAASPRGSAASTAGFPVGVGSEKEVEVASLKDFTVKEVRGVGITLAKDVRAHITANGGADESFWEDAFGGNESQQMYASAWIIDATTRELVWDMTRDNTSGRGSRRTCDVQVTLKRGSYELYFQAYGYASGGTFSRFSMNIDRRQKGHSTSRVLGGLLRFVGADEEERYDDFMEYAKDRWGVTLAVPEEDASSIQTFSAPMKHEHAIVEETGVGDNLVFRRTLDVGKETRIHVYAVGEGRQNDDVVDFGWLVNARTRQRVWDMNLHNVEYAGGASKNIKYDADVTLPKGRYELYYVTDGSHSNDDWNARPPYDPFNCGVTITVVDPSDAAAIKVTENHGEDSNVIVKLTEIGDNEYRNAGFSLSRETPVHIYALGEAENDNREMADYGWIVNTKTHERVWTMERRETYHAGGDSKNRLADEIVTLPKGSYMVYYQTDGSHSYDQWNSDEPFDPEHWGITVTGAGEDFDARSVSTFSEEKEEGILAQLTRVGDDENKRQRFSVTSKTRVRVYAIGEADDDEMADYGWIENAATGERVWEMEYDNTSWAGGARKNRLADKTITLEKGEYVLHFRTDGSHAYNDWNDDPPEDRTHWGITVYKSE